jgi:hypothetical protein
MTNRLAVAIHDGGLRIDHVWFRRSQIAWSQVAAVAPPEPGESTPRCWLLLHDGRRILVERLSLPSLRNHVGNVVPHPDVRMVIDHFLAWQRAHGVS